MMGNVDSHNNAAKSKYTIRGFLNSKNTIVLSENKRE